MLVHVGHTSTSRSSSYIISFVIFCGTSVDTVFCTTYNLGPPFPNNVKILKPKVGLGLN